MCIGSSPKKQTEGVQEAQQRAIGGAFANKAEIYDAVPGMVQAAATEDRTAEIQKLQGADYNQMVSAGGGYGAQQYVSGGNRSLAMPNNASGEFATGLAATRQAQGYSKFQGNIDAAKYSLGATSQAGQSNNALASMETQNMIAAQAREQKASADTMDMVMGLGAIGYSGYKDHKAKQLATKRHEQSLAAMGGRSSNGGGLGSSSTGGNYSQISSPDFWGK